MVAVISAFDIQQKSQVKQQLIAEVQQNGRAATYMLARDIRMTSYGLGDGEVTYYDSSDSNYKSYRSIEIVDSNPDRIEILYATTVDLIDTGSGEVNALTTALITNSGETLTVDNATGFEDNDIVIITNGNYSSLLEVTNVVPPTLGYVPGTGVNPLAGTQITTKGSYDVGSRVYKLRYMTYRVSYADPSHPVMQVDRDGPIGGLPFETIAEDIEDLQAVYVFEDGGTASAYNDTDADTTNDYADIRAVRITVDARTRVKRDSFKGDGYGRRSLRLELKIRNFGL
ncbi:MAG: hypothetical protein JRF25_07545 [Deltaproteobacteria bacterium]|nr:hypothetical protein [Deltaproteobacteria bacterium]